MAEPTRGRPRAFDRDEALNRAILLFWRRGYESTSVRDLTAELGIGAPSLYSAFGDKRQLFDEAVRAYESRYGQFIDAALAEEPTAKQAVHRILSAAPGRYTRRGLPTGCLIVSGDAGTTDAAVSKTLRHTRERNVDALTAKITADIHAGRLTADIDARTLARYTMTMLNGIAQAARDRVPRHELIRVAEFALQAWP